MEINQITEKIIGAAIEIHKTLFSLRLCVSAVNGYQKHYVAEIACTGGKKVAV